MPTRESPARPDRGDRHGSFSAAVDLIRRGETVLTLIDPAARERDPDAFGRWLSARLAISELPGLLLPPCDPRCEATGHDADAWFALTDLALDPTEPRAATWWAGWNGTLDRMHQSGRVWYAGAPAMPLTPGDRRLAAGTRLRRIASTDPHWVTYDGTPQETLFRIGDGPLAGGSLIAVSFGPAPLLPSLAGVLIGPDHPPAREPQVAARLLAAGWSAVGRGLPYEE